MIRTKDSKVTNGYLVPIGKPGKDPKDPSCYRPINLLSTYRKLLSLIILDHISDKVDETMSPSQFAYQRGRSTGDIVLIHKYLIAGAKSKGLERVCMGIDMSKAFDTIDRSRLLNILKARGISEDNVTLIKILLSNTSLQVNQGKNVTREFKNNRRVPQGDCLSPILFTLYLDEALKEIDREIDKPSTSDERSTIALHDHDYTKRYRSCLRSHLEDADNVDFLCDSEEEAKEILQIAKNVVMKYNLTKNEAKPEIIKYTKDTDHRKVKKLGTILDEVAEFNRSKQLPTLAMIRHRKIWRNHYINIKNKMSIYNVYVRSILLYNCSTTI